MLKLFSWLSYYNLHSLQFKCNLLMLVCVLVCLLSSIFIHLVWFWHFSEHSLLISDMYICTIYLCTDMIGCLHCPVCKKKKCCELICVNEQCVLTHVNTFEFNSKLQLTKATHFDRFSCIQFLGWLQPIIPWQFDPKLHSKHAILKPQNFTLYILFGPQLNKIS